MIRKTAAYLLTSGIILLPLVSAGCGSDKLTSSVSEKDGWGMFTNTQVINDWMIDDNYLLIATEGGILKLDTRDESFLKYTALDGLPDNSIQYFEKDSKGNIWFVSGNKLERFKDSGWESLDIDLSMEDSYITAMLIDNNDNIWIGTGGGVVSFNDKEWKQLLDDNGRKIGYTRKIFQDSKGRYWFISMQKISCLDGDRWTHYDFNEDRIVFTRDIVEDRQHRIWIGTNRNGVICIDGEKYKSYLGSSSVKTIFLDTKGGIWVGTEAGANYYDGDKWTIYSSDDEIPGNWVWNFFEDDHGAIWCASGYWYTRGGISYLKDDKWYSVISGENLTGNAVIQDSNDNLWFYMTRSDYESGYSGELYRYNRKQLNNVPFPNEIPDNSLRKVFQDDNGDLWIGTNTAGISSFDGDTWTTFDVKDGLSNIWITAIAQDAEGAIWCNAFNPYSEVLGEDVPPFLGSGVNRYKDGIWSSYLEGTSYHDEYIWDIYLDSDDTLWFCTEHGLMLFDGENLYKTEIENGLAGLRTNSVTQDQDGNIWVISDKRIVKREGENWIDDPYPGRFDDKYVSLIFQDRSGNYWFGTYLDGIYMYDGAEWKHFTEENELAHYSVNDIVQDKKGNIWVGTEEGLNRFDGNNWYKVDDPFISWGEVWDMYIDTSDVIWFATDQGLIYYTGN